MPGRILPDVHLQLYLCQDRQRFPAGTMQHLYGIPTNGEMCIRDSHILIQTDTECPDTEIKEQAYRENNTAEQV